MTNDRWDQETAERHAEWAKEQAEYEARFQDRKAADYHTRCRDCGTFVKKWRWVSKDSAAARPLCHDCWSEYDWNYS
ncbi:hypothetical protein [Metapseudomonas otitidis]|uniref:hypothetical protein n=1 Tax=Metapseudomonas otitidis TaxID=319939 RepID=UPI0028120D44|nr:hypothetical protein [Pseudomonas otitidis]WMR34738.1 hypothetical protein QT513_08370 [Pseudomonas otitidis]